MTSTGVSEIKKESLLDRTPLKKFGTPQDVANLAVFLASDQSKFITGQSIRVCGGLSIT